MLDTHLINVALESLSLAAGIVILIAATIIAFAATRQHGRGRRARPAITEPLTARTVSAPVPERQAA